MFPPVGAAMEGEDAMRGWMKSGLALMMTALLCAPVGAMAQSAVVNNGSDLDSRLNLRQEAGTQSRSLGSFYTGTQVEVVADAGSGWTQVTLGGSVNSVSGYMSSQYLAGEAAGVIDATRSMEVVSPYGTQSVVLRSEASDSYDAVAMLAVGASVQVIGVADGFYYVQLDGECVGCLASDELK